MKNYAVLFLTAMIILLLFLCLPNKNVTKKTVRTSGAMEAMHFWNQSRAYPNKTLPAEGITKEFIRSNQALKKSKSLDEWEAIGPHNIGGRTISLAFNPQNNNTIWAGSASGGLWRSYTAGEGESAWEYVSTGFPVLGVGAIAIAPNDSNEIYIGTGEVYNYENTLGGVTIRETRGSYGIGILKTTDGGKTWSKSLDWSYNQGRGVMVIRINPQNENTIYAGTTEGTYRSNDAGATWRQIHSTIMVTDIVVNSLDTNEVLLACGNLNSPGNGIYKSSDAGSTWIKKTSGLPSDFGGKALFSVYNNDPDIIYLSIGNGYYSDAGTWLCKTTNGGDTWTVVSTMDYSTYQGWFAHFAVVNQANPNKILAAGVDVFKSVNGGLSFSQKSYWYKWDLGRPPVGGPEGPDDYSHADHHAFAIHPDNPDIIYFGNDGGVFRTTDFGETFEGLNGGYQTTQFYNGFSSSLTDSLLSIGGMQDNATAIYDGSLAWIRAVGGDGGWAAVNQGNNSVLYGSWQYLNIVKLTKFGNNSYSQSSVNVPSQGATGFIAPYVISSSDPNIMYAGRGIIYKSINGGRTWQGTNGNSAISFDPPVSMEISSYNPDVVYVGTAPVDDRARIFTTRNGGTTWDDITNNLPDRYPMDIAIDFEDDQIAYVVFSGFGTSHLFKTTNAGMDWINIGDGLPDVPTTSVAVDPQYRNNIYVGNDLGVFVTTDGGNNWSTFNEGLPDACMVTNLSVSLSNRVLRIATHGNGAFERKLINDPTSLDNNQNPPVGFKLFQNYPNPFNPITVISYAVRTGQLSVSSNIQLKIYDILGREITTLVNETKAPGNYEVQFDASNLPSGVYFYRLRAGQFSQTRKMLLLR